MENQATDRAYRMGQKQSVQVYRYLMENSVEERIEELKIKKSQAFEKLFGDMSQLESPEVNRVCPKPILIICYRFIDQLRWPP